ncbi:choline/ethanolaminephosphotransferase 1 bbc isoform X7 [Bombus vancouverensis nearcticus]|uniref:diacylglycerol cholinephosphotransferase n=2 Tax=Pyrobombus TaxID=144703 RepID=A0A6P8MEE6_9HYME|nr:cholinephosphotransferase 1 isoform X5 [Bombus impatiens]XP_033190931.1 cholinephosphotransferase 1 isoform X6 [Bombus vancouverensis nearcticus]XP_033300027.1 cholinephosphotransferase 1 isoform X6 [Bombus bifarius]XP_050483466.1 cholinephosphotransferase 1 isoform X5 [Bombus huntii]
MQFYKEKLLSPGQLKRLSEHKYSCTTNSLLDGFLQPWWDWLVSKVPLWLAPNLITIVGLIVNIATTLILVYYSPDAKTEAPRWACFLCALGLFIYQSLDAIDGKQARRTGTSTPLGELFDHGCDSISTVFIALSACIAVQLGYYPTWMFFQCFCAMTLFYCAHWQTYVSGSLRFGKVDVTEAQFTIIMIHLISAIFGPQVWMIEIPVLGVGTISNYVAVFFYAGYIHVFLEFCKVFESGGIGKNGSTIAGTSVLSPIIPFSFVVVPAFIIYRKSAEHVYENHPALYILAFGMVAAKVTNRLVVAHMTKNEMEYLDTSLIGPAMLFLNQYFNFFIKEYYVLWLCFIWVTLDLLRYNTQICLEICDYMKIKLFRIPLGDHRTSLVSNTAEKNVRAMVEQEPLLDEDYHHGSDTTLDL